MTILATTDARSSKLHFVVNGEAACGSTVTRYATEAEAQDKAMCFFCSGGLVAERVAEATGARPDHAEWVAEAVTDGAALHIMEDIVLIVATDGDDLYAATPNHCSCPAGGKGKPCKHLAVASYLLGV